MLRPPTDSIWGRDISYRAGESAPRPLVMPPPLFMRLFMRSGEPPDCGVKCRQSPPLVEASGLGEFPGL
jgi:hypothetical protein